MAVAVAAGLVVGVTLMLGAWAIRSLLPQPAAEPDWPPTVESVTTGFRPGWLGPAVPSAVVVVIDLRTEDPEAVRLAIDHAVRVEDPEGEAEQIEVTIRDNNGERTFTIPLR
ncbi:hypothetical protein [Occultella gossypii]|uniref:Uncharacterized protein n=1 Tax=Occultella gossypii TaxID=2800820 RepID=A0ABS7SDI5_9MICO|nr:hypothetical protein [Occultella gossypii]MBZ2197348.1 hypothetical protein [Occultella gossypii]